jgi:hypothetical protein
MKYIQQTLLAGLFWTSLVVASPMPQTDDNDGKQYYYIIFPLTPSFTDIA